MIEFRVGWAAGSNALFEGVSDWMPWDDEDASEAEVAQALTDFRGSLPIGLGIVLEASGFEWWSETRVVEQVS